MDIKLFDKRYVHLEWSDELEGKDCILAETYRNLKDFVNSGNDGRIMKVNKGNEKPFTNGCCECDFCYYDPNLKVKKALIEGKEVQYYSSFDKWEDLNLVKSCNVEDYLHNEDWDEYEWRIKPKCNSSEPKYYLSVKNKNCLEFTISQDITIDTIYKGTRKECERMLKIINSEFEYDCNSWRTTLNYMIDKYSHEKYKRRMTNRELSEWLAKGNGEMKMNYFSPYQFKYFSAMYISHTYAEGRENEEIECSIMIRDFGSDEWRVPTIEI